jgi:3-methyladenine DNA glycosylase AlkD
VSDPVSVPVSEWADAVVAATREAYAPLAVPADAGPMAAYMKGVAPFLGIRTPVRRAALRTAWAPLGPPPAAGDLASAARALWAEPEREYPYAACDLLARFAGRHAPAPFLAGTVEPLLVTRPWWDTVDGLGSAAVRPLLARFPELVAVTDGWSASGDRWLVRSAILDQLGGRAATDQDRLFERCRRHGGDREFFVAKAIGWALRDHARTAPDAVRAFVARTALQPLSVREALKHVVDRAERLS